MVCCFYFHLKKRVIHAIKSSLNAVVNGIILSHLASYTAHERSIYNFRQFTVNILNAKKQMRFFLPFPMRLLWRKQKKVHIYKKCSKIAFLFQRSSVKRKIYCYSVDVGTCFDCVQMKLPNVQENESDTQNGKRMRWKWQVHKYFSFPTTLLNSEIFPSS